jgi:hypothetical protein
MALPLIPVAIWGGSLLATAFGAKKGKDAYDSIKDAKECRALSGQMLKEALTKLENAREKTNQDLEELGGLKLRIYSSLEEAVKLLNHFKEAELSRLNTTAESHDPKLEREIRGLNEYKSAVSDIVKGGVTSAAGGALTGLAAYGAVGTFGAASTGTAISTLGGVAASNATLAWLGGGALYAGGGGVAAGTAVLGGIVTGPILALGGWFAASKAEAIKNDAYTDKAITEVKIEEINGALAVMKGIDQRIEELEEAIVGVAKLLEDQLAYLNALKEENRQPPYNLFEKILMRLFSLKIQKEIAYSDEELMAIHKSFELMVALKELLEVGILNEDGTVSQESDDQLKAVGQLLVAQ